MHILDDPLVAFEFPYHVSIVNELDHLSTKTTTLGNFPIAYFATTARRYVAIDLRQCRWQDWEYSVPSPGAIAAVDDSPPWFCVGDDAVIIVRRYSVQRRR